MGHLHGKEINLDTDLTPFTKINSPWIIDVHIKCKTVNLLEGNIGENLDNHGFGDNFLDTTPKTHCMKDRTGKLDFIKIKISPLS